MENQQPPSDGSSIPFIPPVAAPSFEPTSQPTTSVPSNDGYVSFSKLQSTPSGDPQSPSPVGTLSTFGTPLVQSKGTATSPPLSPREQARRTVMLKDMLIQDKITIVGTKQLTNDLDGHVYTVYRIKIGDVEFEKRYSEFRDFYDLLKVKHGYTFEGFPGKLTLNNMSEATIQRRSAALEAFLNDVNSTVPQYPERAALLDGFLSSANKLAIMKLAASLLQSAVTYVPEIKAGIDATVAIAKATQTFPVEKISFLTNAVPVSTTIQAVADFTLELASNQTGKKQLKKVKEGVYIYTLAMYIAKNFETDTSQAMLTSLVKQFGKSFLSKSEVKLFTAVTINALRTELQYLREETYSGLFDSEGKLLSGNFSKAKSICKKYTEFFSKVIQTFMPDNIITAPCKYAVVAGSDFGRRETLPFSNFNFVILVENKHIIHKLKAFFERFVYLLELGTLLLGDTILPKGQINPFSHMPGGKTIQRMLENRFWLNSGFRYDTAQVSPAVDVDEFVTTPKKFSKLVSSNPEQGDPIVRSTMLFPRFVAGSKEVYNSFIELKTQAENKLSQAARALEGVSNFASNLDSFRYFKVEHNDFIENLQTGAFNTFHTIVSNIARILIPHDEIQKHETHSWRLIKLLFKQGFLSEPTYKLLRSTFDGIMGLRIAAQISYFSDEERIFPEGVESGRYSPKLSSSPQIEEVLQRVYCVTLLLLDVARLLEKEQATKGDLWTIADSSILSTLKDLADHQNNRPEAKGILYYQKKLFLDAAAVFEAEYKKDTTGSFIDIERRKTLLKYAGISLLSVLDGRNAVEIKKEANTPEEWIKRAREAFELFRDILKADPDNHPKEEESFIDIFLLKLSVYEGKDSALLLEEAAKILENAVALKPKSKSFTPLITFIAGEIFQMYYSRSKKQGVKLDPKVKSTILEASYNYFQVAQNEYGLNSAFELQCDAIEHLQKICQERGQAKESKQWDKALDELQYKHSLYIRNRVFTDALKTCGLALLPLLKEHVTDVVKDHIKQEVMKKKSELCVIQ